MPEKKFIRKSIAFAFAFVFITVWVFSGWPQIFNPSILFRTGFPPEVQEARAAIEDARPNATAAEAGGTCDTTNAHTNLGEDVDGAADGNVCAADSNNANHDIRLQFATPSGNPSTVTDAQVFAFRAKRNATGGNGSPTVAADLYCNGSLVEAGADQTLTDTYGIFTESFTFNTGSCAADGSDVEVFLDCTSDGGGPNARSCSYESVEWRADVLGLTFSQTDYRWYVDNDAADPTDPWGNPDIGENTAITITPPGNDPPSSAQELRLRVNMTVNGANLAISSQQFKIQFKAGTDGSCTTGTWTDVGAVAASAWQFATSGVADGADIVKVLSTTTTGKGEEYAKSNPTQTNHVAASIGELIEYDFHIIGSGSDFSAAVQYSFRVVESDGTVLDAYTNCPTLTTEPDTSNFLRHGNVLDDAISGGEQGFFWVQ